MRKKQTSNENEQETESEPTASTSKVNEETSFIDLAKMACLLCKRRFESVEVLNKHISKSDLHKV
jgi:RNA-binding protein 5/10